MKRAVYLLTCDWHINSNCIQDFNINWDEMLEQCNANGVSTCVIGGDLFTSRSSQTLDVLMAVKYALLRADSFGINICMALGNHDLLDQGVTYGYPSLFDLFDNVNVVCDKPAILPLDSNGKLNLVVMRYWNEVSMFKYKMVELRKILDEKNIDTHDVILFVHEGIAGGLGDFVTQTDIPKEEFSDFKKVLSGHYHNAIKIKNSNIEYIGSTRQRDFGEDKHKGYTLMFSDGTYSFIENEVNTRYITFEIKLDDLNDEWLNKIKDYRDDDYKVRVKLKCTDSQSKTIDKEALYSVGVTKLEVETEETIQEKVTDEDLGKKFDARGIRDEYKSYCDEKNVSSKLGMKYLNMI